MMLSMFNILVILLALYGNLNAQTIITSTDRLQWDQEATSLTDVRRFSYIVYIDSNIRYALEDVMCAGISSPFTCDAKLPFLMMGSHALEIATVDTAESPRSFPPLFIQIDSPKTPTNVRILKGNIITAASCNYTDVQAKIDMALNDESVFIPAGTCIWTTAVSFSKSINILGKGAGTKTQCDIEGQSVYTCIKGNNKLLTWITPINGTPSLSGITFYGDSCSDCNGGYDGQVSISGTNGKFRIYENTFFGGNGFSALVIKGFVRGVGWNNKCSQQNTTSGFCWSTHHDKWLDTGFYGDKSWSEDSSIGTSDAFYWEDNIFTVSNLNTEGFCTDDFEGARVVYRFNTITDCTLQNHGTESGGRSRGYRHVEYYRNTITNTIAPFPQSLQFRGGSGYCWQNIFISSGSGSFTGTCTGNTYRRDVDHPSYTGTWPVWGGMGIQNVSKIIRLGGNGTTVIATMATENHKVYGTISNASGSYIRIAAPNDALAYTGNFHAQQLSRSIIDISIGNPTTITTLAAHNFETGDVVSFIGVTTIPNLTIHPTTYIINVVSPTKFTIPVNVTAGCSTGCSNGYVNNRRKFQFVLANDPGLDAIGSNITLQSPFDGNNEATGWIGLDAFGSGKTQYISGDIPPFGVITPLDGTGPQSQPVYGWLNRLNGIQTNITAPIDFVKTNRDIFNENSLYNGISQRGVFVGINLPVNCMVGDAAWIINQGSWNNETASMHMNHGSNHTMKENGKLYKCISTNAWAAQYGSNSSGEPYAYPHPLREQQ